MRSGQQRWKDEWNTQPSCPLTSEAAQRIIVAVQLTNEQYIDNPSTRDGYYYITFTRQHFKYLGSWISDTLQDEYELDVRLKRAKGEIGSLKPFFRCPGIQLVTKYKVYMAIPVNTALCWGCESWSITEKMRWRIRAFHNQSIGSILRINMHMVDKCRIKNPTICQWFCNTYTLARHREEETTGLDRKGGPNRRDKNPTTTTHVLDE